ncbi:MAG: M20/M25/M40 family metallo-hydrolase, partial [Acidobacteriota bacterium]|nr:M20/M25/M40 family metallo-hydrolase [Acidobacteriota bacterium]
TGGMRPAGIPAAAVSAESADLIAGLAARGRVRMRLTLTPRSLPDAVTYNVIGDLKGSEHPEQVVVVSGHLDSWDVGTGALDDGAGLVMALQAAQVLRQLNLRPRRTIRVIAWAAEEVGLVGARTYAREHAAELGDHVAAIESDTGAGHALGFLANTSGQALPLLRPVTKVLESSGANLIKTEGEPAPDLIPLRDAGVPSFLLLLDERDFYYYHHTAADTLDKVRPGDLAEDSAAVAVLAYALANMAQPLPR